MIYKDDDGTRYSRMYVLVVNNDDFTYCLGIYNTIEKAQGTLFNYFLECAEDEGQKISITETYDKDNGSWFYYVCEYEGNENITSHVYMYMFDEKLSHDEMSRMKHPL